MNLYATVSSERASKGQGGNEFISIELRAGESREVIDRLELKPGADEGYDLWIAKGDYEPSYLVRHYKETKGEKRKGENDCESGCAVEHLCSGVDCKKNSPHDCK